MSDRLIDMLQRADAALSRGNGIDVDAAALDARRRAVALRRGKRRRRAVSAAVLTVVAVGIGWLALPEKEDGGYAAVARTERGADGAVNEREVESVTREIERIRIETQRLLARLDESKERNDLRRRTRVVADRRSDSEPRLRAALAAETAGQAMLLRGDLLQDDALTRSQASSAYRRVIELFPASSAAADARLRLVALDSSKGDKT